MAVQPAGGVRPAPAAQAARRRWWSIHAPPQAAPISAARGYAEVLLVFGAFFAASILAGAESLGHRYPAPSGSWAIFTPAAIGEIAMAGLAIVVVVLLAGRRGISIRTLGLGVPRKADGRPAAAQSLRIGAWALIALLAGALLTSLLATGKLDQPTRQDGSYLLYATTASLAAGIIEETVALAFVVTTLRQASRPLPEILVVAVALRCSYHDYYGPGVVGIAVWATVFLWLFLRTGSVVPLIVVHFLWDASVFYGQQPALRDAIALGRLAAFVLLPLAAGITWLMEVLSRQSLRPVQPASLWPYAGPYPGPSGGPAAGTSSVPDGAGP